MLPEAFLQRMKGMLGEEYPAFLKSYEAPPCHGLRLNPLKGEGVKETVFSCFSKEAQVQVPWCENGYYYDEEERPGKHPFHEAGLYYIQEPSAMSPGAHIDAKPGEKILDLCAAPGGKTTQIAAGMQGRGILISNEIHPARAKILAENVERMGIKNVIVTNEAPNKLAGVFPNYFDKIMVDAPCSGEGMFRKNPEAREEWSVENVRLCAKRQLEILECAADMLRAGGRLVYSTCTFSREENEAVMEQFCGEHEEFRLIEQGRLFPHKVRGEGHFFAVLEKQGTLNDTVIEEEPVWKGYKDCEAFMRENLKCSLTGTLVNFGDTIHLLPPGAPSLRGLKVLRAGLQLGVLKKNRFEPAHALALALRPEDVVRSVELSIDSRGIYDFINGEVLSEAVLEEAARMASKKNVDACCYDGTKGWYLICVEGYSIGWGKLAGGVMKNHYPKGLRKQLL